MVSKTRSDANVDEMLRECSESRDNPRVVQLSGCAKSTKSSSLRPAIAVCYPFLSQRWASRGRDEVCPEPLWAGPQALRHCQLLRGLRGAVVGRVRQEALTVRGAVECEVMTTSR